jgi:hypothetical protein
MVIDTSKLKVSTKSMISAVLAFGGIMQIPAVSSAVLKITTTHPAIASIVGALMGVYAVLHNPQVESALGIEDDGAGKGQA